MKCYYCEYPIEKHDVKGTELCINVIGLNILGIPDIPFGYCYNCIKLFKKHSKSEKIECLTQICKISQKETGLELDDSDLTRHPKDIVEACIIDNKLEK